MSKPQNYANHSRLDPKFHLIIVPILFANVIYRAILFSRHPSPDALWAVFVAVVLQLLATTARVYSLQVQDRVIRMEERIRLAAVASPATLARIDEFTVKQLVALRFAPYSELGPLADRTLSEHLTPKQIKQAIVNWRPDLHRV